MLRHNLLLTFRSFKRFKSSFIINLIGLSTGLTCTLLIYLWVNDELSVDRFHINDDQLYQVLINRDNSGEIITQEHGPGLLASTLADEMPEVEHAVSYTHAFRKEKDIVSYNEIHINATGDHVGEDFFKMFSYELLHGTKDDVLVDKTSIVISEGLAMKLFGTTDNVIGKIVQLDHQKLLNVSGVFKDVPELSHYKFDFLLSYDAYADDNKWMLSWSNNAPGTYILLKKGTDINAFNEKIKNFVKRKQSDSNVTIFARPFSDSYLYDKYENGVLAGGRIEYVRLFAIIAVFILFIACLNFMNLSTARASRRIKELGIKKALGARRESIAIQFLSEGMLMAALSVFIAIVITVLLLPGFNEITGKQLVLSFQLRTVIGIIIITALTGLVSGSYPAWYLSRFKPVVVLKGTIIGSVGEIWVRRGLVVFQFMSSVILIVSVLVVYKQISFIQTKNLGYDKDNIVSFPREGWAATNLDAFLAKIKTVPGVINASSMMDNFIDGRTSTYEIEWSGKKQDEKIDFQFRVIGPDLFETLKIEMSEGRTFSEKFTEDSTVIVNEAAIKIMGMEDAIGRSVKLWGKNRTIVGVTSDFQFASLYEKVKPLLFIRDRSATSSIMVRIQPGSEVETIIALNEFYAKFNPGLAFDFKFMDQDYQALYHAERRVATLSKYFAGLAILISCMGLYGLVAFIATRRQKEIGIRKILGSTNFSIVGLLSKDFTMMVVIAILIALPASYFIAKEWLDKFQYRIELEWWFFAGAASLTLALTWVVVGLQTIKAAALNPLECVKEE